MLRRFQTGKLGSSLKANKCIGAGTEDLGVLTTHEATVCLHW